MFTTDAQAVIDQAKDVAVSQGHSQITVGAITTSIGMDRRGVRLLSQCLNVDGAELRRGSRHQPRCNVARGSWPFRKTFARCGLR